MKLLIVESPTKAKTISKFLGSGYQVESSYGHVRDLPKSRLGIDIENDFQPHYLIMPKAKPRLAELKKTSASASGIILATDEDREGEAIAWHLVQALDLDSKSQKINGKSSRNKPSGIGALPPKVERIVFHEITKSAIKDALKQPRPLDMNLIDSQQARRILDRLVGYELSPFLWRKVRWGLSAGRVQSVAVRLVAEREREIQNFRKEEYWTIEGKFSQDKKDKIFSARLYSIDDRALQKMELKDEAASRKIVAILQRANYRVKETSSKIVSRFPAPPFTTSTLQQEASRQLGFSAKQTMLLAQNLYESGLITYVRTDSVHLADQALKQAKEEISRRFGSEYSLDQPRRFLVKSKGAQEAHEAIRPTDLSKTEKEINFKDKKHQKLYELVWKRTLASQMKEALLEQLIADIETSDKKYVFRASGQTIKFDGFLKIYPRPKTLKTTTPGTEEILPALKQDEKIEARQIEALQHFTEPPPRYNDATLVKTLEAAGVGRPSTYAPILSTIVIRGYVEKINRQYQPTEIGLIVNDILVEHFPEIVDINFTSHIEEELDEIAEGKIKWTAVAKEFYTPFKKRLEKKETEVQRYTEISDTLCPHCGKPMLIKFGRFGKYLACPDPKSKITLPLPEEAAKIEELKEKTKDERCPLCGQPMEVKRGRFGFFLGCRNYPNCKGIKKIVEKTGFLCPSCLTSPGRKNRPGDIIKKNSRQRNNVFYGCSNYPECTFVLNKKPENEKELKQMFEKYKERSSNNSNNNKKLLNKPD